MPQAQNQQQKTRIANPADVQALMEQTSGTSGPPSVSSAASSADVDALLGPSEPSPMDALSQATGLSGGKPSLLNRVVNWATSKPYYGGTLDRPGEGRSPLEQGLTAAGMLTTLAGGPEMVPAMPALARLGIAGLGRASMAGYGAYKGGHVAEDLGLPKTAGQVVGGATGLVAPELIGKYFTKLPWIGRLMSRVAPAAEAAEEPAAVAGAAREMAGGTAATTPARSLVLSPEEAQAESVLNKVAQRMASQRGMRYAAGMNPGLPETAPAAAPIRTTPFGESPQAQAVKELLGGSPAPKVRQVVRQVLKSRSQ